MSDWHASPAQQPLAGELRVPSDKSISHRAVLLAGLASGTSTVSNPLFGQDVACTIEALRTLGAHITQQGSTLTIEGCAALNANPGEIYCGNSGTLMRLLAGAVCARSISCTLTGDESLSKRPMKRIVDPLRSMGADITASDGGRPPISIAPVAGLHSISYAMPMASAQVKSAVLLAGLNADRETSVIEPAPSRDHTERMLPAFGASVIRKGSTVTVQPCSSLQAAHIDVPADISSAAFFMVAASIVPGSDVLLRDVGVNPTRTGAVSLLRRMGADLEAANERMIGSEPVADIRVRAAKLHAIEITAADVPSAIDEIPVLLVAAATAAGTTKLSGAAELRAKESDRIAAIATALGTLGIKCVEQPDGIEVQGGSLNSGEVDSCGDHRIAMAMAAAALRADGQVRIRDCENVATSFPDFGKHAASVGWPIAQMNN